MRWVNGRLFARLFDLNHNVNQAESGEQWTQQFFPKRPFAESSDGLYIIRRGQGPPEQVTYVFFPGSQTISTDPHNVATLRVSSIHHWRILQAICSTLEASRGKVGTLCYNVF